MQVRLPREDNRSAPHSATTIHTAAALELPRENMSKIYTVESSGRQLAAYRRGMQDCSAARSGWAPLDRGCRARRGGQHTFYYGQCE